jgi:hypothetical protein
MLSFTQEDCLESLAGSGWFFKMKQSCNFIFAEIEKISQFVNAFINQNLVIIKP